MLKILPLLFVVNFVLTQEKLHVLTILEYGLPPNNAQLNARDVVADRWGVKIISVGECVITNHLRDSIQTHNDSVFPQLLERFGANWEKQFKLEQDAEFQIQQKVLEIIEKQIYIQELEMKLQANGNELYFFLYPEKTEEIYFAQVYGYGELNGNTEFVSFYILEINLNDNSVMIKSDTIERY